MYTTAVISPSVVRCERFLQRDKEFLSQLAAALYEIAYPGNACLVDARGQLTFALRALKDIFDYCTPEERKSLVQILSAFASPQSSLLVKSDLEIRAGQSMIDAAARVALQHRVDGIACDAKSEEEVAGIVGAHVSTCTVERWKHGQLSELNRTFAEGPPRCANFGEARELVARLTRVTHKIMIFDKMLARTRDGDALKWKETIEFIMTVWDDHRINAFQSPRIELYAMLPQNPWYLNNREEDEEERLKGHEKNHGCLVRLFDEIVRPLNRDWQGQVEVSLATHQHVSNQLFHDRWLWAGRGISVFSAGFDFVRRDRNGNMVLSDGLRVKRDFASKPDLETIVRHSQKCDESAPEDYYRSNIEPIV